MADQYHSLACDNICDADGVLYLLLSSVISFNVATGTLSAAGRTYCSRHSRVGLLSLITLGSLWGLLSRRLVIPA